MLIQHNLIIIPILKTLMSAIYQSFHLLLQLTLSCFELCPMRVKMILQEYSEKKKNFTFLIKRTNAIDSVFYLLDCKHLMIIDDNMRTEGPHAKDDKEEKNSLDLLSSFIDTNTASNYLPTAGFLVMCRKDIF